MFEAMSPSIVSGAVPSKGWAREAQVQAEAPKQSNKSDFPSPCVIEVFINLQQKSSCLTLPPDLRGKRFRQGGQVLGHASQGKYRIDGSMVWLDC
jgi:hypothetical protein